MTGWHLAQLNVARLLAPLDSPELAGFVGALQSVNAVADAAPGFVWRLQDEAGDATSLRPWGEDTIVNMSVWESVEALRAYVFGPEHAAILRQRRSWFDPYGSASLVLWWIPRGHVPSLEEAKVRLDMIEADGPSPAGFTLRSPYSAPS